MNWLAAIPKRDAAPAPDGRQPAPDIELSVPEIKVSDGQVHVQDLVPQKGFKGDLSGIQASLRGFALPQPQPAQAEVAFNTGLGEQVKYAGSLTLSPLASEGAIEASRIRLVNYQPYYEDYILYKVEDGVAELRDTLCLRGDGPGAEHQAECLQPRASLPAPAQARSRRRTSCAPKQRRYKTPTSTWAR